MKKSLCAILISLFAFCYAMQVPSGNTPIVSDDNMISGLLRVDPQDEAPERLTTKTWFWQDEDMLVAYFEAEIDSTFEQGQISNRDSGSSGDWLRIQLITTPSAYFAYSFTAYPKGNLVDGTRDSNLNVDYSWNSHYNYTSAIEGNIWKVTMRIPITELRFKQQLPYRWKVIVTRYYKEHDEYYSYPYLHTDMGYDYFLAAADLILSTPVKHRLDFSIKPYYVKSYDLVDKTDSFDPDHIGMDMVFNPGQRTRIKLSLNPDFSDIPMDSASDNYNSKYPPYFSENRFFFTEDIDAFGLNSDVFYTRNIVQPRLAFKATGNSSSLNWGLLGAFDKRIVDQGMEINRDDYYQVLAMNPTWNKLRLRTAVLSRMNDDYANHVFKSSLRWEFIDNLFWNSSINLASLSDDYRDAKGYDVSSSLKAEIGDMEGSISIDRRSDDYYNEIGYYSDNDYLNVSYDMELDKNLTEGKVRSWGISHWGSISWENYSEDALRTENAGLFAYVNLKSKVYMNVNFDLGTGLDLLHVKHTNRGIQISTSYMGYKYLGASIGAGASKRIVYALNDVYPRYGANINLWANPLASLSFNLYCNWTKYDYPEYYTVIVDSIAQQRFIDSNYLIFNSGLTFNPSSSFSLSFGTGLSTYESANRFASLNYYGNMRYEFRPEQFLYIGFKSAQSQIEESSFEQPFGHYRKDMASAYAKLSITL